MNELSGFVGRNTYAGLPPVSAWFAGKFGPGRLYIWCLMGFGIGSALCGLAWDLESIVVFRVLQAIPGGILPVVTLMRFGLWLGLGLVVYFAYAARRSRTAAKPA